MNDINIQKCQYKCVMETFSIDFMQFDTYQLQCISYFMCAVSDKIILFGNYRRNSDKQILFQFHNVIVGLIPMR